MNAWTNKQTNKRTIKWTHEWANGWINECMNERIVWTHGWIHWCKERHGSDLDLWQLSTECWASGLMKPVSLDIDECMPSHHTSCIPSCMHSFHGWNWGSGNSWTPKIAKDLTLILIAKGLSLGPKAPGVWRLTHKNCRGCYPKP